MPEGVNTRNRTLEKSTTIRTCGFWCSEKVKFWIIYYILMVIKPRSCWYFIENVFADIVHRHCCTLCGMKILTVFGWKSYQFSCYWSLCALFIGIIWCFAFHYRSSTLYCTMHLMSALVPARNRALKLCNYAYVN